MQSEITEIAEEEVAVANNSYIFNQYYVELLKVCKNHAKAAKDRPNARGKMARDLLRAIKKHYSSFDKISNEHISFFKSHCGTVAHEYNATEGIDAAKAFLEREELDALFWYKDIPYSFVKAFGNDLHQNWTTLGLLVEDGVDGAKLVDAMRKMAEPKEFEQVLDSAFEKNDFVKVAMKRLRSVYEAEVKSSIDAAAKNKQTGPTASGLDGLADIEDTSLGRLAKEIMEDPEVRELHASLKTALEDTDGNAASTENLMSMFGSGEHGGNIAKLMGTVSQKMIQKLMTGEIKQETLLQDAMQFAGKLGGLGGLPGGLGDLSGLGSMLGNLAGGAGGGAGGAGGFDFSSLLKTFGGGAGSSKAQKSRAASAYSQRARVSSAAQRARRKLDERRHSKKQDE